MTERTIETVAVYKENRVKVYGITEKTNLTLAVLSFPTEKLEMWGQLMIGYQEHMPRFELITYHAQNTGKVALHLLYDLQKAESLHQDIKQHLQSEPDSQLAIHQPVDVLFLFGPHFQDRFGIVDIGIRALMDNNIPILASGCAGTSMYFVTPQGTGKLGVSIFSKTFLVPTTI